MTESVQFKSHRHLRSLVGKHIDEVLGLAMKRHYACDVVYGGKVKKSAGRKILTISVDSENIVRQVK